MLTIDQAHQLGKCYSSPHYFVHHFCQIYDATTGNWESFHLWPAQRDALAGIHNNNLTIILKARQLGMSWLCIGYALWQMIFRPAATVLVFSRRDTEALYLLSNDRLRGMFNHLPVWMKSGHDFVIDSGHEYSMQNGSSARAFPTSAGDSYTASLAIVDEADLVPDLNQVMRAVKPTIDNGGKMILVSRVDKSTPTSEFKNIYRAAHDDRNGWTPIFLPWNVHPGRDDAWYERQKVDIESRTGALDDLHEQYPATDTEALAPRSLDKRIPSVWIEAAYAELSPLQGPDIPALPKLQVYKRPMVNTAYVIGADPAEGNPNSDDSAATVMDVDTGTQVAQLSGKFEPATFGFYLVQLSKYFNDAGVLVERNNHGHAVLLWIKDNSPKPILLPGKDGKPGWLDNSLGKSILYNDCATHFRISALAGTKIIHNMTTYTQLGAIEGSTLRAPDQMGDDQADSFALANLGRTQQVPVRQPVRIWEY